MVDGHRAWLVAISERLVELFGHTTFSRALQYFQRGQVLEVYSENEGRLLLSRVRGRGSRVYQCHVQLNGWPEVEDIVGYCTCPVGINCKHVAATLLAALEWGELGVSENRPVESPWEGWVRLLELPILRGSAQPVRDQVRFLLHGYRDDREGYLTVIPWKTYRLKSGGWAKGAPFTAGSQSRAACVDGEARELLMMLETVATSASGNPREGFRMPVTTSGERLLRRLVESERLHWGSLGREALALGPEREGRFDWRTDEHGDHLLMVNAGGDWMHSLPVEPPWYLDPATNTTGPLNTGLDARRAALLAAAPRIAPEYLPTIGERLRTVADKVAGVPVPDTRLIEVDVTDPVPVLRLFGESVPVTGGFGAQLRGMAALSLEYDGVPVAPLDGMERLTVHDDDENTLRVIRRDFEWEERILMRLEEIGLVPDFVSTDTDSIFLEHLDERQGWIDFLLGPMGQLQSEGWHIEIEDSFPWHLSEPDAWYGELEESEGGDWFNLELGVELAGERVPLLPLLVNVLANARAERTLDALLNKPDDFPVLVSLSESGTVLKIPFGRVRAIVQTLVELLDPDALQDDGRLRLSRFQAGQLEQLDEVGLEWGGDEGPRRFAERLAGFREVRTVPPPAGLRATLRPYQRHGLNWLQFLREYGLGGILADDMGLGKTIQALAHLLVEKAEGRADRPSLVVATTSLMHNWKAEAERFAPELRVLVLQGAGRKAYFDRLPEYDLVLSTYPLLSRDADVLTRQSWHLVILDEAQHIKNPRSRMAQVACRLDARHRLCLTGTPIENHLGELWSQFHFLMPGLLGSEKQFRHLFRTPIEKRGDTQRQQALNRRLAPFLLRREKQDVASELPEKTEIPLLVELKGAQRQLYETIRVAMDERVRQEIDRKGMARSHIVVLDALLKLRQVCCDPRLLKMTSAKGVKESAKLEQLMEMLPELVEEGRRILLFSQFTSMLSLIEKAVREVGIEYVKLTGQVRDRRTPVERFQQGEVPLFLISLKAGGAGLNLTRADTVIHYDPWWNPAVEQQATDRAHRIGQQNKVFVYRLMAAGTVEEKIHQLQERKQALADALFSGQNAKGALERSDLEALFQPLDG